MGSMIVIEGIDGAGKTTQAKEIVRQINKSKEYRAYYAKSPQGSKIGEDIKFFYEMSENKSSELEMMSFLLSNTVFYQEVLLSKLFFDENNIVVLDRWFGSFLNYFCFVKGFSLEFLERLNKCFIRNFFATDIFLLDISPEMAMERIKRKKKKSRFDKMGRDFLEKQRDGFLVLAEKYNWHIIDGSQLVPDVQKEICSLITPLL